MPDVVDNKQDVDIDLKQLLGAIWQRRLRILALTASVSALAFVGANLATPSYQSEARLLIEQRAAAFAKTEQAGSDTQPLLDELNIASQVQVLSSADLIKRVAHDLHLTDLKEFDATRSMSYRILKALHLKKTDNLLTPEDRVVDKFIEKLQVYQVEKSRVIGIQFVSEDPRLAAAIPNAMMATYALMQSDAKIDSNYEATQWLEPEIASLRQKVEAAEKKVADYRASQDIPQSGDVGSLAAQQLKDIATELARVRSEGASARARAEAVRSALASGGSVETLADVSSSAMMQKLKENESTLKSEIADLSTTLMSSHPKLKALRSQLGGIQVQIRQETTKILSSIENEAKVARLREAELASQFDAAKADSARSSEQEVGLNALEREAAAERQLLETYLARYREAASRSGKNSSPADARVISQAIEPREATFPKILPITIIAGLATLILSSVTILLLELFSGRALKPALPLLPREEEVETSRSQRVAAAKAAQPVAPGPVVAAVAAAPARAASAGPAPVAADVLMAAPQDIVTEPPGQPDSTSMPEGPVAESADDNDYSIGSVARHLIENRIPVAFGLSPGGDDGSTGMVVLAREIAETGERVVLVDMTASLLPTRLMASDRYLPGMSDLLNGDADFGEAIHSDRLSDAHIVPRGRAGLDLAMQGADRLPMIIGALCDAYDVVLVECGPADVRVLAGLTRNRSENIILSMPKPDEAMLTTLINDCAAAGYTELMLMSDPRAVSPRGWFSRFGKGVAA
nr:Wzz/FepE/Etk N-terminal domain-containing protein [uncultured Gellertiella sp.]